MKLVSLPLASLVLDPRNAKKHGRANLDHIKAIVLKYGQYRPLVVQKKGNIVRVGNGLCEVLRELKWEKVDCIVKDISDSEAEALSLADNRSSETSVWDDDVVKSILQELPPDLAALTNFDLDALLAKSEATIKQFEVKNPPQMAWFLIGVPVLKLDQAQKHIDSLAALDFVIIESSAGDAPHEN